jgi:hypothetical protein
MSVLHCQCFENFPWVFIEIFFCFMYISLWGKYIQFFVSFYVPTLQTLNLSVLMYQWTCKYCHLFLFVLVCIQGIISFFLTVEILETKHWHHGCFFVCLAEQLCYIHHTLLYDRTVLSITSDLFRCLSLMYITILILLLWLVRS